MYALTAARMMHLTALRHSKTNNATEKANLEAAFTDWRRSLEGQMSGFWHVHSNLVYEFQSFFPDQQVRPLWAFIVSSTAHAAVREFRSNQCKPCRPGPPPSAPAVAPASWPRCSVHLGCRSHHVCVHCHNGALINLAAGLLQLAQCAARPALP